MSALPWQELAVAAIVLAAIVFLVSRLRGGRPSTPARRGPDVPVGALVRSARSRGARARDGR